MSEEPEEVAGGINDLPDELIITIFIKLPLEAVVICEDVCRRWRKLARDRSLWRRLVVTYSGKPGKSEVCTKNLDVIATHGEYINCLKLQYVYSYPIIKSILVQCKDLISLEMVMCRLGKDFEEDIARWPNIKKLNLKNSLLFQSAEELAIQFDQFKHLNYLSLSEFGLSPVNSHTLLSCKNLVHILIEKIRDLDLDFIMELITVKQNVLETFRIYGGDAINDHCLHLLSKCPVLKDLAIIRCENLTDNGLISLVNLKQILHLQIWNNTQFSEMGLLRTLGSPNLVKLISLSLSRIGNISPIIVDLISEYYKDLKFLGLYQCARIINTDYEKQLKSKFRNIDVVLY